MFGLVKVRYNNFPINLLYNEGLGTSSLTPLLSLRDLSIGTFEGLQASKPVSDNNSRVNFL